jgi:hypothetical protein
MPVWVKYAIVGAVVAVATDYFIKPTLGKSL